MESRPPLHLGVVAFEKEAFGSTLSKFANFTFFLLLIILTLTQTVLYGSYLVT